jgi:hypothetical protein
LVPVSAAPARIHATGVFNDHIAQAKRTDVQEGWEPLCKFLGVKVRDTPFPKTNSTREFRGTEWKQ